MIFKMKIVQIILLSTGATIALAAAPTVSAGDSAPAIFDRGSTNDFEWDFQHIENGLILDKTGKPAGKLENATRGLIDATHAYVESSKKPKKSKKSEDETSMAVLRWPKGLSDQHFTISLWVNIRRGITSLELLQSRELRLGAYRGDARLGYLTSDKIKVLATYPDPKGSLGFGLGQWHHLAATYEAEGGKVALYIDGAQVAEAPSGGASAARDESDIKIGGAFAGSVADVRLSGQAATPSQIRAMFEADKDVYVKAIPVPAAGTTENLGSKEREVKPGDQALHEAWLDYRQAAPGAISEVDAALLQRIVAPEADSTVRTAADELDMAITRIAGVKATRGPDLAGEASIVLGTPKTSPIVARLASRLQLERAGGQGYILQSVAESETHCLVVAANSPAGVIAGTFALIRRLQLGEPLTDLNIADAPKTTIRLVNHWSYFGGFPDDAPKGRDDSIFNWADLRSGHTARIREWARLLASAGYNAVCPTELNWSDKNNFLEHLDEVKILAGIFRDYGIKLYWTPNYLLAPLTSTADSLYAAVPDFGGYLLKFGSEGQPGDPGPKSINQIARLLAPHGGTVLVRGFIYGKYSPLNDEMREVIPYKFFGPLDGQYDKNVVIVGKSSPLDFEIREPINALDGVLKQTRYGTEVMIAKDFPMSWLESWKRWTDFDNRRNGPGTLNRDGIDAVVGVAMISPDVPWTPNPLNMVNYYGLGRLSWDPSLTSAQIRSEWIGMTFGPRSPAAPVVDQILVRSDAVADDLMLYHGYRGVWIESKEGSLRTKLPDPLQITRTGIGADGIGSGLTSAYAPEVKAFYEDKTKSEDLLLHFHFLPYDYRLTNGRTLAEDMHHRLIEGVAGAEDMLGQWKTLEGKIDPQYFACTTKLFESYADEARKRQQEVEGEFADFLGTPLDGKIAVRQQ